VVQRRIQPDGEVDHRSGAVDVRGPLGVLVDGDVVDRGAVHHVVDVADLGDSVVGDPEVGRGQVADQRFRAVAPLFGEALEPGQGLPAHQHPHLGVIAAGQNPGYDAATNEPGTAGNDIAHASHGDP
jgi:hypothetical protein